MDLIAKGAEFFEDQRKLHLSVDARYRPAGSMFDRPVKATPGMTRWEGVDTTGAVIRMDTQAFFIAADEIPSAPVVGDRIIVDDEIGRRSVYEVMRPALADECWNWSDRLKKLRRIHCVLVSKD